LRYITVPEAVRIYQTDTIEYANQLCTIPVLGSAIDTEALLVSSAGLSTQFQSPSQTVKGVRTFESRSDSRKESLRLSCTGTYTEARRMPKLWMVTSTAQRRPPSAETS
jgi:hypothetical protein